MKLGVVRLISRDDLAKAGGELPKWLPAFLQPLNDFLQKAGQALQGQLTFEDNFLCRRAIAKISHSVELEINPYLNAQQRSLRVTGVLLTDASGLFVSMWRWKRKENGNITVTVRFDGGTADTVADCTFIILLG